MAKPAKKTPSFDGKNGVIIKKPEEKHLQGLMKLLTSIEVLVGFPDDGKERVEEDGTPSGMTNAALGYLHDHGQPEINLPARPFMDPGIASVQDKLANRLGQTAKAAAKEGASPTVVEKGLIGVGLIAQAGIKNYISSGIGPPITDAALRSRIKRNPGGAKGAKTELAARKQGETVVGAVTPLIDTGAMHSAINFVVRPRSKRN